MGRSAHKEEYERLMTDGWSSLALEKYAAFRYGEEIPASTFRTYRGRLKLREKAKIAEEAKPDWMKQIPDAFMDVLSERAAMIRLQQKRIAIDVKHEDQMQKLFGSTKGEIALLATLLDQHKGDLQDLGLFPKAGEKIEVTSKSTGPAPGEAPVAKSLADLFGTSPEAATDLARVLHMNLPRKNGTQNGVAG